MSGKIILLNGASSSGKSTLAAALQSVLPEPFWHVSIDHLLSAGVLPRRRIDSGEFLWSELRPSFFDGFHRCIPALAQAGNNLIVEHIVETGAWLNRLLDLTAELDVFYVGVHCPLAELERRERERGDRRIGEARTDFETVHAFGPYDLEVRATEPVEHNASAVCAAWQSRPEDGAFARMRLKRAGKVQPRLAPPAGGPACGGLPSSNSGGATTSAVRHSMFSHVFVGVSDFERALGFYRALMPVLGIRERFCEADRPWAGWQSDPGPRPLFLIGKPYDKQSHEVGNGQMVALVAQSRQVVDQAYAVALANGGTSEGAPGLRPEYHANYYGAYFRDTEGNKLCIVCHVAPE